MITPAADLHGDDQGVCPAVKMPDTADDFGGLLKVFYDRHSIYQAN